jgi:hypothetical protein
MIMVRRFMMLLPVLTPKGVAPREGGVLTCWNVNGGPNTEKSRCLEYVPADGTNAAVEIAGLRRAPLAI